MLLSFLNLSLYLTIAILLIKSLSKTFLNACASAVLVEISKNKKHEKDDKKLEKFNTSIIYINLGTILSSTTRGIALEYLSNQKIFFISGIMSCLDIIAAVIYKEDKYKVKECGDESNVDANKEESFSFNRKGSCKKLYEIIKRREIILLSIYMLVMTLVPSYYESSFYYLSDKKGFTKRNFGHLTIILMVLFLINSVINKNYLNKYSKKKVIISMTIISFLFSSLYHIYIYFDLSSKSIVFIGVSLYISFKSLGVKPIFNLTFLACPKGYEGSIMGLIYSLRDFGDTCASLMGSWMAYFLDIQKDGYKNFSKMVFIINLISLLPIGFIRIINDKSIIALEENKN
jgi:Na+/melibiose symporter-like transporter